MAAILDLPEMRARVRRWTVAEYAMLEGDPAFRRSELIRGIILERPPQTPLHFFLRDRIAEWLRPRVRVERSVRQVASLQLADSVPEPDVSVVLGALQDFRSRHPTTAELVVEVAEGSVALEQEMASLYAEAGVAEYWIVLAEAVQVEVYRQPVEGVYRTQRIYARGESIEGIGVTGGDVMVDALFA